MERLALQALDFRVQHFLDVVRQNFGAHTHGNAFRPDDERNRNLCAENFRLGTAPVVVGNVVRDVRIGHKKFLGKRIDTAFNVTPRRRRVARKHIAKVSLRFQKNADPLGSGRVLQEQPAVCHRHHRAVNGSVAVRVVLHRLPHHVRHFLKASVVHLKQRMHNAPLHRL